MVFAPVPNATYTIQLNYILKPTGLSSTTPTTYLSEKFPNGLLYACLVEAYGFLKGPLDMLQHYDKKYVEAVKGTNAKILDTRKPTPGWRVLEKMAVKSGGGLNHRMGLFDMAMLKDNHLTNESDPRSLQQKINAFKKQYPEIRLELEADTLEQVNEFIKMEGVDVILLDNMALTEISEAVSLKRGEIKFEASGGINLDTVVQYAEAGVDFISVGALTHSAVSVDLSLELET